MKGVTEIIDKKTIERNACKFLGIKLSKEYLNVAENQ